MPERQITLRVWRSVSAQRAEPGFDEFTLRTDPERDMVLDLVERAWAEQDQTLVFRHACHHASCGTCTIRVDGRERLPCITRVSEVWNGRAPLTLQPLRNVPIVADLAIDPEAHLDRMAALGLPYVRTVEPEVRAADAGILDADVGTAERFEDCLECLACVSACPVAAGDPAYLGPAVLAAADRLLEEPRGTEPARILALVDSDHGVWQCRSVWACSAVCPSDVGPAMRIMDLRRRALTS
jgi:succinate dehydrogenase / fumarate reductase iron-sulfur subunit